MSASLASWSPLGRALDRLLDVPTPARPAALAVLAEDEPSLAREVERLLALDCGTEALMAPGARVAASLSGLEAAGWQIDGWRLLSLLGRGGMGDVYLAARVDRPYEQLGALKLIRRGLDSEEILARFVRERQILARLAHPGIARLLDGGMTEDGRPYFVLERVEGRPLGEHVAAAGLSLSGRLRLFLRIAEPVEAAHRALVVHRDLKPGNVLVTPGGEVKLLDFGIAKVLGGGNCEAATQLGLVPLTPAYASPEQILGGPIGTATDVYSLGVLLHELLVGERPHPRSAQSPSELARITASEVLRLPSEVARGRGGRARELAGDLDAILLRALQADPERRYPSVAAFAEDVKRHLDGRPVAAKNPGRLERARKLVIRHRWAFGGAALAFLCLAAGLTAALVQGGRASRAATRATRVERFLVELFAAADPDHSRGEEVSARQLLDLGAARLEAGLADQPEARAEIADTLARTYFGLGDLQAAEGWSAFAVREGRRLGGPKSPEVALAELTAIEIALERGEIDRARIWLEAGLPGLLHRFGEESHELLRVRRLEAELLRQEGDTTALRDHQLGQLPRLERLLGPNHPWTAEAIEALAVVEAAEGRYAQAEARFRDALARLERAGLVATPVWIETSASVADVVDRMGRYDEALGIFETTVDCARRIWPRGHPNLADLLLKQGISLLNSGRAAQAEAVLDQAREQLEALGHAEAGSAWRYLGHVALSRERYPEAEDRFRKAEGWMRRTWGEDHRLTWMAVANRALAAARQGRLAEAERDLRAAVQALERLAGSQSDDLRGPLRYLGETLRRAGRADQALEIHARLLALERTMFPDDERPALASTKSQLAADELARGTPAALAAARGWSDQACAFYEKRLPESQRLADALLVSAEVAWAQGDARRAHREARQASRLFRHFLEPSSPSRLAAEALVRRTGN